VRILDDGDSRDQECVRLDLETFNFYFEIDNDAVLGMRRSRVK